MSDSRIDSAPHAHVSGQPGPGALACWRCQKANPASSPRCGYCQAVLELTSPTQPRSIDVTSASAETAGEVVAALLIVCWRCQKENVPETATCRYCRAKLAEEMPATKKEAAAQAVTSKSILTLVAYYSLALFILLIFGWAIRFGIHEAGKNDEAVFKEMLPTLLMADGAFATLVVVSFLQLRRVASQPPGTSPLSAWIVCPPLLAALLFVNFSYHALLRQFVGVKGFEYPFWGSELWGWTVLIICVQPALVEELFFRQVVLGVFRKHMSVHGAVWVSAIIFGLAHLGGLISIPTLVLAGLLFGYARVATGNLVLPMVLHFTHNLVVIMLS